MDPSDLIWGLPPLLVWGGWAILGLVTGICTVVMVRRDIQKQKDESLKEAQNAQ